MNAISVGGRIAEKRKEMKLSQAELAEMLSVSPQAVSKWERGDSLPDILMLAHAAEIFKTGLDFFRTGECAETAAEETDAGSPSVWNLSLAEWKNVDFSGVKNLGRKLRASNVKSCLFVGAGLSGVKFSANNLLDCSFKNADIARGRFAGCDIVRAVFDGAKLAGAQITGSKIAECGFAGADLTDTVFKRNSFFGSRFDAAVLRNALFSGNSFARTVFASDIDGCVFTGCTFKKCEFINCTLQNTLFKNSKAKGLAFTGCMADKATFSILENAGADTAGITLFQE
jgi:uncharacterized protein YjbI with pentapeptide repeats/DNA-binding XRE family transcriptional regulator